MALSYFARASLLALPASLLAAFALTACGGAIQPPGGGDPAPDSGSIACTQTDCSGLPLPPVECEHGTTVITCSPQSSKTCGWSITCIEGDLDAGAGGDGGGGFDAPPTDAVTYDIGIADGGTGDSDIPDGFVCPADACGPALPIPCELCGDGTCAEPICAPSGGDTCGWSLVCSATDAGRPDAAFDAPLDAPLDGPSLTGTGQSCGGDAPYPTTPCPSGEYCNSGGAALCGATDAPGVCTLIPESCDAIDDPVCGCDGKTYGNACEAASVGASVASNGACNGVGATCGGFAGITCGAGLACMQSINACNVADADGSCIDAGACGSASPKVCGCDGDTYANQCVATQKGIAISHDGACK